MAVSAAHDVIIEATPAEILDVIADIEQVPVWSPQYIGAEILERYDDGRPRRAKMTIKAVGLTDDQVLEYTWTDTTCSWVLISSGQLRKQEATYTLTPVGQATKVRFEISVDPVVPVPGFLLKNNVKGGAKTATEGLRRFMASKR